MPYRSGTPMSARHPRETELIGLVDSRYQSSIRAHHSVYSRVASWYSTYRAIQRRQIEFRNNIAIPFIFAMVQSDVARKVQMLMGSWPIVSFSGYAPEDEARAKRNEILVSAQLKDNNSISKGVDFLLESDLYGVGLARYGWKRIVRKNRIRSMEAVAPGFSIPVMREYDAEMYNGPNWEVRNILDVKPQPGKKYIDDMAWIIDEYWLDYDDMLDEARTARDGYSGDSYFDPVAVQRLKDFPMGGDASAYFRWRMSVSSGSDYLSQMGDRYTKPVHIKEMLGLVPSEFATDGIRARCVAIGNDRVVLKDREIPFWDQQKPIIAYSPMPDPQKFYAPGKVEIAEKLQEAAERLANNKLDALDQVIDPQYVMSSSAGINKDNLISRAGRIILVDGAADDTNIRPLIPQMQGFKAAYGEISTLWQYMQLGAGINDIIMGLQPGERETARGFLGRQENTLTRLNMEALLAGEQFLEPLGNAFRKMDQWWLPMPYEQKILGSLATINPITGLPYPQEVTRVDYDDLAPDYRARAVGPQQMLGKNVRQQNLMSLLQIMSANPALLQLINWANFARQAFEVFDMKNVNELLVSQVPMVNQIAAQNGQSPEAVAGMASEPMGQISPEILGAMLGGQAEAPVATMNR